MIYLEYDDLLCAIRQEQLDVLLDGMDWTLEKVELACIKEMKKYLRERYEVETIFLKENRDAYVIQQLVDLVIFQLCKKYAPDEIPAHREKNRNEVIENLEKAADGFVIEDYPLKVNEEGEVKPSIVSGSMHPKQNFRDFF